MISSPGCECLGADRSRLELDDHLDDLASGDAQVVPLEIDAPGSDELRLRHVQRQAGGGDQRRDCNDSSRFHVNPAFRKGCGHRLG